jgi:hypothetical protein
MGLWEWGLEWETKKNKPRTGGALAMEMMKGHWQRNKLEN